MDLHLFTHPIYDVGSIQQGDQGDRMNSRNTRNIFVYALIGVAVLTIIFTSLQPSASQPLPLGTVIQWAQEGKIQSIEVRGEELVVQTFDGTFKSQKEPGTSMVDILSQSGVQVGAGGVQVEVVTNTGFGTILGLIFNFLPLIFLGLLLLFIMRQAQGLSLIHILTLPTSDLV